MRMKPSPSKSRRSKPGASRSLPNGASGRATRSGDSSIELFISHSHSDRRIVEVLCGILQRCLRLTEPQVRCTTVPGTQLLAGAAISPTLMREAVQARVFIALYSLSGRNSPWVAAEIGARLGRKKKVYPLVFREKDVSGPILGLVPACLPDGLQDLLRTLASDLGKDKTWLAPANRDIKALSHAIKVEVEQMLVPEHFDSSFPGIEQLSADVVVGAARPLHDLIVAGTQFAPSVIVALNEGGMILAASLAPHFREAQIGSVFTAFAQRHIDGRPAQVRDVDTQRVALPQPPAGKEMNILVVDTKLKTGESACNTVEYLRKTYPGAEVRLAVVLAYGGWQVGGVWPDLDLRAWPATLQIRETRIPTYVVYYTDCDPKVNLHVEAWRLRRKMP
jgi:hypoxanthine phosphoribosyltransferase